MPEAEFTEFSEFTEFAEFSEFAELLARSKDSLNLTGDLFFPSLSVILEAGRCASLCALVANLSWVVHLKKKIPNSASTEQLPTDEENPLADLEKPPLGVCGGHFADQSQVEYRAKPERW
ncbi:MAG: hypothetical protein U0176_11185 [Bacteroidia bacterium]